MPRDSRIGDLGVGICFCHSPPIPMVGMLVTGAPTELSEYSPPSRLTDIMLGFCGHVGIECTCSPDTRVFYLNTVRISDAFSGCFTGVNVTGAGTVGINSL